MLNLVTILCVFGVALGAEPAASGGEVLTLDHAAWDAAVVQPQRPAFVYFYREDAARPRILDAEMGKLARKYDGIATVGTFLCSAGPNMDFCTSHGGVTALPAMRVFAAEKKRNPYTNAWYKESKAYEGPADANTIAKAVVAEIVSSGVARVASLADWETWSSSQTLAQVLVFSKKTEPNTLVRTLSMHYSGKMVFAMMAGDAQELLDEFNVDSVPAILVRLRSGDTRAFEGALNVQEVSDFLSKFAPARIDDEVNRQVVEEDTAPLFGKGLEYSNVSFAHLPKVLKEVEDSMVIFFAAPGEVGGGPAACEDASSRFSSFTSENGDMLRVAVVETGEPDWKELLSELDVKFRKRKRCHLEVLVKPFGTNQALDDLEAVDAITSKAVLEVVYDNLPDLVVHLSSLPTMQMLMGQTPGGIGPLTPKIILSTNKGDCPPFFKLVAANFRKKDLAFAWFSTKLDPEVAEQIPTPTVPYILATFIHPDTKPDADGNVAVAMEPFKYPFKYKYIKAWLEVLMRSMPGYKEETDDDDADDGGEDNTAEDAGPVQQVQSDDDLAVCTQRGGLCCIAFLDSRGRELDSQLRTLQAVKHVRRGQRIYFRWVDAPRQPAFSAAFLGSGSGLPTVAMLVHRRMQYSALRGSFTEEGIAEFINEFVAGQLASDTLSSVPGIVRDTGEDDAVEDEFDLNDIMSVEL